MFFGKNMVFPYAIFAAAIAAGLVPKSLFAEATEPPPQTNTDGGGGIPDGAGNGGMGDGTNEGGRSVSPPSCYVMPGPPSWFVVGPPVEDWGFQMDANTFKHIIYYDSKGKFQYQFTSPSLDDITPVPGTSEEWTQSEDGPRSSIHTFYCVD